MADLFLSYAREDRECAEALARALYNRGWTVWWDRRIPPGQTFSEVIERELGAARCVIVLWSRNSLASDWVKNEAAEAASRRALVPVRIENVTPPFEFRRIQAADLFNWQSGFSGPDFDACLASIERLVRRTAEVAMPRQAPTPRPQPPTAAPRPAAAAPPQQPRPVQPPQPTAPQAAAIAVTSFLIPAILVTLGCCVPFGIVAIVYATQVNTKLASGDVAGAMLASQNAKKWALIGFGSGLAAWVIFVLLQIANS